MGTGHHARIERHYGSEWCVFADFDDYSERRLYASRSRDDAARFAEAWTRWANAGAPIARQPLGIDASGRVIRQADFDAALGITTTEGERE